MAFAAARTASDSMSDINITPLVDVMLVLLVIFMVTAPMMDFRLQVGLAQSTDRPPPPTEPVVLAVDRGDVYRLGGEPISPRALPAALEALAAPGLRLQIQVDPDADYQTAATALAAVERSGIENYGLVD